MTATYKPDAKLPPPSREGLPRIPTGTPQLDAILGGGFPTHSINILLGEPGSGKTILAERLIFANAQSPQRPVLYLTTLSEPLEKVVRYLQQFEFYDEEKLTSGSIIYDSIAQELEAQGIAAVVPKLKEIIKTLSPSIIVIDSFKAIHDLSASVPEMRRMLYEVSGLLTAYDTTAFLVGEYNEAQLSTYPEFAVADGMVELARRKHGTRDERYLRVLKLRGSSYLEGLHAFRISANGLEVFPRLTSPEVPLSYSLQDERLSTGVVSLDTMMQGGVRAGSSTLIQGRTGSGKTTLALQFILEGLRQGEPGLYINFQENPTQLARVIQGFGWDVAEAQRMGLHLLYHSPVELQIDSILVTLFRTIAEQNIKRVAVDSIGDLISAASDIPRLFGYLYALVQHFSVMRVASVLTMETTGMAPHPLEGQISALSDAILHLQVERLGNRSVRTLQVLKARGTDHDLNVRELRITSKGVEVV
ncbi:ATPase domain-containing protein [Stigmatella hybrida]|uniref:ATPase domain-containing protein n=1 Tax=Stigmatella hybrida TaxID=394097 RepID=UPI001CDA6ABB|nr:ATPase domain-containing protein [Stigmatella hybrida]